MKISLLASLLALSFAQPHAQAQDKPVDGKFPPPQAPEGKWEALLKGSLADNWTGMSVGLDDAIVHTAPNPDRDGEIILHLDRGPTGLLRSLKPYENFILELEWRHLTEAPSANGAENSSGNSGLLIAHGPYPKAGGPYPPEGHEVQVCNLGNGSWYTSHGDLFSLPGTDSQATPDPRFAVSHACGHRSMPTSFHGKPTGEWNHVRITCVDGTLQQEVNGTLVTSLYRLSPRKGYISFESEGAATEFRNMRIQELLPDPDLAARHVAPLLPEPMVCAYLKNKKATPLPTGNFILMADLKEALPLADFITGLELPKTPAKGRLLLTVRDQKYEATLDGKPLQPSTSLPAALTAVLHLETKPAATGHVLLLTPKS